MTDALVVRYPGKRHFQQVGTGCSGPYRVTYWCSPALPHAVLCMSRHEARSDRGQDPYLVVNHGGALYAETELLPSRVRRAFTLSMYPIPELYTSNTYDLLADAWTRYGMRDASLSALVANAFRSTV